MDALPEYLKPLEKVTVPFPREAMEEAIRRWDETAPHLLDALASTANAKEPCPGDYLLHECALRLLAQHRDTRAYEPAIRLARHPNVDDMLGDTLAMDLGRMLAALSGGDTRLIKELIEDPDAEEFARSAGFTALGTLCRSGQLTRQEFSDYLGELFAGKLVRDESFVWTALADVTATFGFAEHEQAVREACETYMADPTFADWKELETQLRSGIFDEREARDFAPFDDAIGSVEWWDCFVHHEPSDDSEDEFGDELLDPDFDPWEKKLSELGEVSVPFRAEPKVGRNDPCPCGSGKKYKKCCG
jgi:hypothetical protein